MGAHPGAGVSAPEYLICLNGKGWGQAPSHVSDDFGGSGIEGLTPVLLTLTINNYQ